MGEERDAEGTAHGTGRRHSDVDERDGDMGVSSERVGPVGSGRGRVGTVPTYDDPAARPRSTGPNGSVPAPEEPIRTPDPDPAPEDD